MGDRISIKFKNGEEVSPVLFSHWGGIAFRDQARDYVRQLKNWINRRGTRISDPISRMEPGTVMVDFIRHITKNMEHVEGDLYITRDECEGDDSDNGHHVIDVNLVPLDPEPDTNGKPRN